MEKIILKKIKQTEAF